MKISELMIGDWVTIKSNGLVPDTYAQVESIDDWFKQITVAPDICDNILEEQEIHPIPLTAKILQANGFEERVSKFLFFNIHTGEYLAKEFTIIKTRKGWSLFRFFSAPLFYIHYVHELQNALRLCGLNDLADNLKLLQP